MFLRCLGFSWKPTSLWKYAFWRDRSTIVFLYPWQERYRWSLVRIWKTTSLSCSSPWSPSSTVPTLPRLCWRTLPSPSGGWVWCVPMRWRPVSTSSSDPGAPAWETFGTTTKRTRHSGECATWSPLIQQVTHWGLYFVKLGFFGHLWTI